MFDFISFGLKDLIDIAAVVFLVFQFYRLIRGTVAVVPLTRLTLPRSSDTTTDTASDFSAMPMAARWR